MGESTEVLFISDTTGVIQCVNPEHGTTYITYRGASSIKENTLSVISTDYILAAEEKKSLLHVWQLNGQFPINGPQIVAGKVTALAVSNDGLHCAAAIDSKIYIWKIPTGCLSNVLTKHFGDITKIVFLDDGVHIISCGENGVVLVWSLSAPSEPIYSFSHHTLKVTDCCVSKGGLKSKLYTVSLDCTCKIYDLRDGSILLSITFDCSLTAIRLNCIESKIYLGTVKGEILEFNLDPLPRTLDYVPRDEDFGPVFKGHSGPIKVIDISIDGYNMMSGEDNKVVIWDIPGRSCLRTFDVKGTLTNAFFYIPVEGIFSSEFKPSIPFTSFQRVSGESNAEVNFIVEQDINLIDYNFTEHEKSHQTGINNSNYEDSEDIEKLRKTIASLRKTNKELYKYAMEKILDNPMQIS